MSVRQLSKQITLNSSVQYSIGLRKQKGLSFGYFGIVATWWQTEII